MAGCWLLAFLLHVASGHAEWQPWWRDSWDELWHGCGFAGRPSYQSVYLRFAELEQAIPAIEAAIGELVRAARTRDPRIGEYVHIDATDAAAHVRLRHDCNPEDRCPGFRRGPNATNRPRRIESREAAALRAQDTENTPDQDLPATPHDTPDPTASARFDGTSRVKLGEHWYLTRDRDVGMRAYTRGGGLIKLWIGYYLQRSVDGRTGGTLASAAASASRNESEICPVTLAKTIATLGGLPKAVVGDRGLAVTDVFELLNSKGIAAVMPLRNNRFSPAARDTERFDRDGVIRCKHCGSECRQVRFDTNPPRVWGVCTLQLTDGCHKTDRNGRRVATEQSVACSRDHRRLGRLPRTHPVYHELLAAHSNTERAHLDARRRYAIAGNDLTSRVKRIGLKTQLLRAAAGTLLEWTLIAHRRGWLAPHRRRDFTEANYRDKGAQRVARQTARRREAGLDLPYGPQAAALGIGAAQPPSERPTQTRAKPSA